MSSNLCQNCAHATPLAAAWCVGSREGALKTLLNVYKFSSARRASHVCADLLLEQLPVLPGNTVIVPVPTASSHRRSRGFDHMTIIARRVAKIRGLPYRSPLSRFDNETQHFKTRADRLKIATENFEIRGHVPEVILLIDDIYTTGSTLLSCAKILREHGATQVFGTVIARQVLDDSDDL